MFFQRKRESELETKLRRGRPEPEPGLVDRIVSDVEGDRPALRPHSLRIGFAAATIAMVAALAVFGGVTYAASGVQHAAVAVKHVFVAKPAESTSRQAAPRDLLNALQPGKTSAADQYLPPGVTPVQALTAFSLYVIRANQDLQAALNCSAKSGAARARCAARVNALKTLANRNKASLDSAIAKLATLPANTQVQVGLLLAIHLQQEQKLAATQAERRTNCAGATYKSAHKAACAKANPLGEAAERLKLGELELAELDALLARFGT